MQYGKPCLARWHCGTVALMTLTWPIGVVKADDPGPAAATMYNTPVFRLGSGAFVLHGSPLPSAASEDYLGSLRPLRFENNGGKPFAKAIVPRTSRPTLWPGPRLDIVVALLPLAILAILGLMMAPGAAGPAPSGRDFNYRIPPAWSPENENHYSFRAYMTDISLWIMLTDLQPHQQCAAIIMRLGGAAREMARMITPQEMAMGGMVNGIAVDPVTYLLGSLHARFAALEEESRLTSMTEMLAFARRPGETINALLARYETVRQRAAIEGQFVMSIEGCSLQVLRACNIQSQHLFTLLQPFGGRLPQNDNQFRDMCTQLRRYGHISEGARGNIASALHGPLQQARSGSYFADQDREAYQRAAQGAATGGSLQAEAGGTQAFFGSSMPSNQGGLWDSLLPQQPPGSTVEAYSTWGTGTMLGPPEVPPDAPDDYFYLPDLPWSVHQDAFGMDDGTDTDTSSDSGAEDLDMPDMTHLTEHEAAEQLYWTYRRAKRTWRRFTGKPVRKFH